MTIELNTLHLGDCLEVMKGIPDGSIDMILCDLPYGQTAPAWDKIIPIELLWSYYKRVSKPNCPIVLFASQPFTSLLINSNLSSYRYVWYWIKNQGTNFFHAKRMPIRKVEEIVVFNTKKYNPQFTFGHLPTRSAVGCSNGKTYHGTSRRNYQGGSTSRYPTNELRFDCVDNYSRLHSSEKPVALMEYFIKTYTNEGDLVLDNCMGSGTTCRAAKNLGRRYIGIEKDPEYYAIAKERVEKPNAAAVC